VKIAMLGGSFNPPHLGHTALAREIAALGYRKVVFVPARVRPLKTMAPGAGDGDRLAMAKIAASRDPSFDVDPCEMERGGPSFTCDTIDYLEKKYAGALEGKIALVVGDDLLEGFWEWRRSAELPRKADIIVARRVAGKAGGRAPFPHIALDNAPLDISSSDIRRRIGHGEPWEHLVEEGVSEYIKRANLYGYGTF
jgi:nicotinate-nucleotide adenylyltransferase